jgi:hypothetical protein
VLHAVQIQSAGKKVLRHETARPGEGLELRRVVEEDGLLEAPGQEEEGQGEEEMTDKGDSAANQLISELEHEIRHWDSLELAKKIQIAERMVALSMLSSRAQVRLASARILLERYSKPHGLSGSTGAGDFFGEDEDGFPALPNLTDARSRKTV